MVFGEEYARAVPCPSNSSIVGYTDLISLNADIFSHLNLTFDEDASHIKYNYVICPDTTYNVEDNAGQTIIPGTDQATFSCGIDGLVTNNCVLQGGDVHVYLADFLPLIGITFRGFTFDGAKTASVYGDAHPISSVLFEDCVWRNIKSDFVVYVHFTPYDPSGRRLIEGGNNGEFKRHEIVEQYGAIYRSKEESHWLKRGERQLQDDVRYSMRVIFKKCVFENNVSGDAVILSVGGDIGLTDSSFSSNRVERYAVFTTASNGHVYVAGKTEFLQNDAPLGSVFISSDSFLQYNSGEASGYRNTGTCSSIFIEDYDSNCLLAEKSDVCKGKCCVFSDETCDSALNLEIDLSPPSVLNSPTQNDVLRNDESKEKSGCTGFCVAFAVVFPLLVMFFLVSLFVCLRNKRIRKRKEAETKEAAANAINVEMTAEIS